MEDGQARRAIAEEEEEEDMHPNDGVVLVVQDNKMININEKHEYHVETEEDEEHDDEGAPLTSFSNCFSCCAAGDKEEDDGYQKTGTEEAPADGSVVVAAAGSTEGNSCRCNSCLRSSPCASLLGLILGLIGIGAFSGGYLFARKYTIQLLGVEYLCPYGDYICYGILGGTVLFLFVIYIINSFSSGWNSKHFFDSSGRVTCARCMAMTLLIFLLFAVFLWCCILVMAALPVFIHLMLYLRKNEGSFDMSYYGVWDLKLEETNHQFKEILNDPMRMTQRTFICYSVTFGGALLLILSYVQLAVCSAMNYARFEEIRYYHSNPEQDHGDETHF